MPRRARFKLFAILSPIWSFEHVVWAWEELHHLRAKQNPSPLDRAFLAVVSWRWPRQAGRFGGGYVTWKTPLGENTWFGHRFNGVHITSRAVIGSGCTIMQGVTIGTKVGRDRKLSDDAPVIGDDVFLGAFAQIIGRCRIGNGARIGAGVVLTDVDIPAGAVIVNRSAYDLKSGRFIYPQD